MTPQNDELYQSLQAVYLKWHDGQRPLSGFIRELESIVAEEREAELMHFDPFVRDHTKCIDRQSCLGYQNAVIFLSSMLWGVFAWFYLMEGNQ